MKRFLVRALLVLVASCVLATSPSRADDAPAIVVLGDSLTAGLGVAPDEAFPARLAERLRREGYDYRMVNAGVSGDTSAGGLRRVDWVLKSRPAIVVVALGANDGLRGQSVPAMRDNLEAIVRRIQASGARVLLAGMRMPPNYGESFTREFAAAYAEIARRTAVPLVPFLLDGVAADSTLNQPDGIHPNAAGHRVIAERVWPHLRPLLKKPSSRSSRFMNTTRQRVV